MTSKDGRLHVTLCVDMSNHVHGMCNTVKARSTHLHELNAGALDKPEDCPLSNVQHGPTPRRGGCKGLLNDPLLELLRPALLQDAQLPPLHRHLQAHTILVEHYLLLNALEQCWHIPELLQGLSMPRQKWVNWAAGILSGKDEGS